MKIKNEAVSKGHSPFWTTRSFLVTSVLILLWIAVKEILTLRYSLLDHDTIMYRAPIVDGGLFHLGVPFLDDFDGYGNSWGHQWPGGVLILGAIFSLIPYHRWIDILVGILMHLSIAVFCGIAVWRLTYRRMMVWLTFLFICSDAMLLSETQGNVLPGVLVLSALLAYFVRSTETEPLSWEWKVVAFFAAFAAPIVHPFSMIFCGLLLSLMGLYAWFYDRKALRFVFVLACTFLIGLLCFISWFAFQPDAKVQFMANLALQKSFYVSYNSIIRAVSEYRFGMGYLVWAWATIVSFYTLFLFSLSLAKKKHIQTRQAIMTLFSLMFVAFEMIYTVTRCENHHYLGFAAPLLSIILPVSIVFSEKQLPKKAALLLLYACIILVLVPSLILPFRMYRYLKSGCPNLDGRLEKILASLPHDTTVYIPSVFWEVASQDHSRRYRFWTFCIPSTIDRRQRYEAETYSTAQKGDILIVDAFSLSGKDPYGYRPIICLSPPNKNHWEFLRQEKQIFPGHVPWGIDFSIYRYK